MKVNGIDYSQKEVVITLKNGKVIEGKVNGGRYHQHTTKPKDLFINLHEIVNIDDIKEIRLKE